jgi:hypothetical protein
MFSSHSISRSMLVLMVSATAALIKSSSTGCHRWASTPSAGVPR